MPGRSTPGSVLIRSCAAATQAPVLPAEITTSASPLEAILHITEIELLGLLRIASTGGASLVAHEEDDVFGAQQRRGVPAALEDRPRGLVAAHDVHRSSQARTPSPQSA